MIPDIELIAALRRKDDGATAILFDQYGSDVYNLIYKMTGDIDIASTLTIKTFESFEANKLNYNPKTRSIYSWLIKKARQHVRSDIDSEKISIQPLSIKESGLIKSNYSTILNSIFLHGQPIENVAKSMRVPISSVRTRFRLAINALSKKYNSESGQFLLSLLLTNYILLS